MIRPDEFNFESVINVLGAALWQFNLETHKIEVDEAWFSIIGLNSDDYDEVNLEIWKKLIHPDDLKNTLSALDSIVQRKSDTLNLIYRIRHVSKGWILMLDKGQVITRDQSSIPPLLIGARIDITSLKNHLSLFESKNRYKSLMQNIPGAFYQGLSDEKCTMLYISTYIISLSGYHHTDFTSQKLSFADIIHPDHKEHVKTSIQNAIEKRESWEIEYKILHKNGSIAWLYERGRSTEERFNNHTLVEGFIMDITDKKNFELTLVKTKELLDKTNEVAMVGGWEADFSTNKVFWSRVTKIIHEVSDDFECTIDEALNFYKPGKNLENHKELIDRAINEGTPYDIEAEIITSKGNEKWIRVTAQPEVRDGKSMRMYGSIQDVTKRKRDSLKIVRQNKFRELVAHISSRFIKSSIREMNHIMQETLHNCLSYFCSERCFILQISKETFSISNTYEQCKEGIPHMQSKFQRRSLADFPWFLTIIENKGLSIVNDVDDLPELAVNEKTELKKQNIQSILFIRFDINNEPAGVIGVARHTKLVKWRLDDIKDLKVISNIISDALSKHQLELNLIKEKLKAEKSNNAKSEFLANMSHEIRTPLNAILGFSEVLYNTAELEPARGKLDIILNSGRSLLTLINDLLDFSKIESGNISLSPEMLDLRLLLNKIELLFSGQAKNNNIDFEIIYNTDIPNRVFVDPFRLQQILVNLTSNAIKFTNGGTIKLRVDFRFGNQEKNETGELIFEMEDTGIGISKDNLEMIFESFTQAEEMISKKYGGTGLGLAISKKLVELMKGNISAKSELGRGSTFKIILPEIKYIKDFEVEDNLILQKKIFFKSSKLLVIDDVEINNELIKAYLDEHDVEVYTCNSGTAGIRLAEEILPDVVLLDLRMPGISGLETATVIKSLNGCKQTPIIAFTASLPTNESLGDNFSGRLTKPIEENKLFQELRKFLPFVEE